MPQFARLYQSNENEQEAVDNIREAIEGHVAVLEEDGLPIPEERFEALVLAV